MSDTKGEKGSFDPRTWFEAKGDAPVPPPAPPAPPADELTYDFRSMGQTPEAPPADGDDPPPPPRRRRAPLLIIALLVLLLAGAGTALALYLRKPEKPVEAKIEAPPTNASAEAPAAAVLPVTPSRRTLVLSGSDGIAKALSSAGIVAAEARAAIARIMPALGTGPGEVRLSFDILGPNGAAHLLELEATRSDGSGVSLTARDGKLQATKLDAKLETRINVVRGEMDGESFYTSAVAAGVTDSLISDFANAFSFDFNFQTDVKEGDVFEAAFEQAYNPSGQPVGIPKLVYVSLTTAAKSRSLYRFVPPGESEPGWFDGNGRSTVTALMRTPVDGARVSSKFGMRFHPTLHYTRLHGGTDFAAPVGTPIYASAAGVIIRATRSGCAGNMIMMHHDNGWETHYFHLSRYADVSVVGARVAQGTTIGYVGMTGGCVTGPHLHYEVVIDGQKVDPQSIDTGTGKALEAAALAAFTKERDRIDTRRAKTPN